MFIIAILNNIEYHIFEVPCSPCLHHSIQGQQNVPLRKLTMAFLQIKLKFTVSLSMITTHLPCFCNTDHSQNICNQNVVIQVVINALKTWIPHVFVRVDISLMF